jgi:Skp family chaperone for outer membrane proteins
MKRILQQSVLMAAVFGLCVINMGAQGVSTAVKIGVIDMRKVFESYYKKVQTDDAFKSEAENMDKERKEMVEDARKTEDDYKKLVDSANDMAVSKDERDKAKESAEEKYRDLVNRKDAIDQYDRQAMARLQEEKRQKRDALVSEIKEHLAAQAKAGGYNLVFDSSGESANMIPVAVYANNIPDLTDALIKELNAGAPASFTPPTAEAIKAEK